MAQPTACTPLHVIDHAIETLSAPDGYVDDLYHAYYDAPAYIDRGGSSAEGMVGTSDLDVATAHCAIGGVEHAIYKVCKQSVLPQRHPYAFRTEYRPAADPVIDVFQKVMVALNVTAIEMYGADSDSDVEDVEDVSLHYSKEDVLKVFRAARERLVAEQVAS